MVRAFGSTVPGPGLTSLCVLRGACAFLPTLTLPHRALEYNSFTCLPGPLAPLQRVPSPTLSICQSPPSSPPSPPPPPSPPSPPAPPPQPPQPVAPSPPPPCSDLGLQDNAVSGKNNAVFGCEAS